MAVILKNAEEKALWKESAKAIAKAVISHPNFSLDNAPLDIGQVAEYTDEILIEYRKRIRKASK